MNEKEFKRHFTATFLATWVANNYDDACMRGQHSRLEHPPVDDALFLADAAWEEYVKIDSNGQVW